MSPHAVVTSASGKAMLEILQSAYPDATTTPPPSVIVHGPPGCGKTHHAQAIARHFGLRVVVDGAEAEPRERFARGVLYLALAPATDIRSERFGPHLLSPPAP